MLAEAGRSRAEGKTNLLVARLLRALGLGLVRWPHANRDGVGIWRHSHDRISCG
jgi:hypothetical protein